MKHEIASFLWILQPEVLSVQMHGWAVVSMCERWNPIKGSLLGAKVQARLKPRPQLRQPVVYRSEVVESLWQKRLFVTKFIFFGCLGSIFSSVFFPKRLFLQTILKTYCFFFSILTVIRALLIKNKCNKVEWLGYFYIFLFKKKKASVSEPQWAVMYFLHQDGK